MSTVFFTSDPHIRHKLVAEHRDLGDHDAVLAQRWDDTVRPEDTIWVQGDLCSGTNQATFRALEWMKQRPGRKRLITGNHDKVHPGVNRECATWMPHYLDVFELVAPFARRRIAGVNVLMSHFPYLGGGDRGDEERYPQWRLPNLGEWLLHGHTHSPSRTNPAHPRQIHIGVDAWDYTPVPITEIAKIIMDATTPAEV
ncbi:metallophosphoesterase [Mycolicibacterium sphagni]|uniref:metallophosphoesterase n=1 Tax=Mycolicibacterium sphagni TaxID=1786 RepID=UPI0021F2EB09|nr:metallophosphoesterase [Mycolicibacterium sphagni]MCV7174886.1 metallophosphoesterase [Mycolicibacterium sphagni]